jgi:glycosyltransferase involved in cell wall biosynthesis
MNVKREKKVGHKIALVANTTWNIYNFRLNLIDKFISEGHQVAVIAPVDEYIHYLDKYPSVLHYNVTTLDRDGTNPIKDIFLCLELAKKYREIQPDLILHFTNKPNIYGSIAAKMNKIKAISVITGLGYPFIHQGFIRFIIVLLYRIIGNFNSGFIFENTEDRELFHDLGIIKKEKSVSIKGCGVNTEWFKPMNENKEPDKIIFTFIGRLLYDKGIREFVEAAKEVKQKKSDVNFWILGEIDRENPTTIDKDELISWVENDYVQYLGFIADVRPIISASDCIVLPSYREAIARTITEGMSMGKPIITTKTAGCREAVEHGLNGYLVEVKNSKDLAAAMFDFLTLTKSQKEKMGSAGRAKACAEFDAVQIASQIYRIIIQFIGKS